MALTYSHNDGLLNYLVGISTEKRELIFLELLLNRITTMIINKNLDKYTLRRLFERRNDIMPYFDVEIYPIGIRGHLYDYIIRCNWEIEDFLIMRMKEYGQNIPSTIEGLYDQLFPKGKNGYK